MSHLGPTKSSTAFVSYLQNNVSIPRPSFQALSPFKPSVFAMALPMKAVLGFMSPELLPCQVRC